MKKECTIDKNCRTILISVDYLKGFKNVWLVW